jgi:putative transposase
MSGKKQERPLIQEIMPSAEKVQRELGTAKSMDDFFGKEGIFSRLFANTLEQMLEAELSEKLGYEPYEVKGHNSGDSRNGSYSKKLRSSNGEVTILVPRDRNGDFEPQIIKKHTANTNELEDNR